jgi:PhzF family phenazine biosynthesis protein
MKLHVFQVDSFTTELFKGNPAGVVLNADHVSEMHMQQIAREMNKSETAFIMNHKSEDYDIHVRFFTPTKEVPLCGHATIAAHYIYAKHHGITTGSIRQKTQAGILPVHIIPEDDDLRIVMTQAPIEYGKILDEEEQNILLEGLGILKGSLDHTLPIQIISTGHSKVMIPIQSKEVLDRMTIKESVLTQLSTKISCNGYYVFTFDTQEPEILISGRMFAPAIGIPEDPVTGNANGPLGAYLTHYNRIERKVGGYTFTIKQGEAINRKGYMQVHVYSKHGEPELIQISGRARIVFKTEILIGDEL